MSGIFGILQRDGSPAKAMDLNRMGEAMAGWAVDGTDTWIKGPCGLGHSLTIDTPESEFERQPSYDAATGVAMTVEARLDNREELLELLEIGPGRKSTVSDGELIMRGYTRWGRESPKQFEGDWSFAAWHERERRLFMARDVYGMTTVSYYQDAHRFVFASAKKALLAVPDVPRRLNEKRLGQTLIRVHGDLTQTGHLGILRMPGAHWFDVTFEEFRQRRYFRLEDVVRLNVKSPTEAAEGMTEVLTRAVKTRLRAKSDPAISLSGGLDSGSVAVLAAPMLRESGKKLIAYTCGPAFPTVERGDERALAAATARAAGDNIEFVPFDAKDVSPIAALHRSMESMPEPVAGGPNGNWGWEILDLCRQRDCRVLLVGNGGNLSISYTGYRGGMTLLQLARRGMWRNVVSLKLLPRWVRRQRVARGVRRSGVEPIPPMVNPRFIERLGLLQELKQSGEDWLDRAVSNDAAVFRSHMLRPFPGTTRGLQAESPSGCGISMLDPTSDPRVIRFSLSLPDDCFLGPDNSTRYPIRKAMEGHLPPDVLKPQRRFLQSTDIAQRLRHHRDEAEAAIARVEKNPACEEYLDLAFLRRAWHTLCDPSDDCYDDYLTSKNLLTGIACGFFLEAL